MINFKVVRWRNFLSTGNNFTEINLQSDKTTLIVGQNGSGKSTMLDAISFALFGKSHRNINKPQLVNSVNQKNCVVEVEFVVNNNNFKIVRGLKPVVFEIWKNDTLVNQNSHSKEYQKVLEQNILKLNHKSFHQVVVLGSSSFIPFMQLTSINRRNVIEDLLDINVFSKMNVILKENIGALRETIKDNDYKIEINSTKIDAQKKYIREITRMNAEYRKEKEDEIEEFRGEIKKLDEGNLELSTQIENLHINVDPINAKIKKLNSYETEFKSKMKSVVSDAKFYEDNESCPTCEQQIDEKIKEEKLNNAKNKAKDIQDGILKVKQELEEAQKELSIENEKLETIRKLEKEIHSNNETISRLYFSIEKNLKDLTEKNNGDLEIANKEYSDLLENNKTLIENKLELNEQNSYNQVLFELLKDTGIKTKIIKQYLPVMNKLVNAFLQTLDFFVHFNLDESFTESIRSRHRDNFTYDSFSEGEKQRIDLSLLFTWRQIAKMKNSVATNLLILDETFDSSLDQDGIENLMKIINTLDEGTNVFVISHKGDMLEGKFENKIEFYKDKNFSRKR